MFNLNGETWEDLVTERYQNGYVKRGAIVDQAFWSENERARSFTDNRVVIALARPSQSDTMIFKAGNNYVAKIALIQKSNGKGQKAYGEADVIW